MHPEERKARYLRKLEDVVAQIKALKFKRRRYWCTEKKVSEYRFFLDREQLLAVKRAIERLEKQR